MKTSCLLLVGGLLLGAAGTRAQTLEDKVVAKSCACLHQGRELSEAAARPCISQAMGQMAAADTTRQYLRQLSTIEQVQGLYRQVYARLLRECRPPTATPPKP